jgi:hypothetical protein
VTRETVVHLNASRQGDSFRGYLQTRVSRVGSGNRSSITVAHASIRLAQSTKAQNTRRVTIRDVAEVAGVSTATVSNVINNTGSVSEATKQRVRAVIQRTKWTPNVDARNLARSTAEKPLLSEMK